ncbi:glycoside hydrolase family 3 N-terminal domain-containing protein [Frankia sp. AgKG'84/4]|uniref:glycoside hydrolase family 3 N-terminal domain-containing protein n=1 Tax=Frankia sp. AgKG'84/4 TaxID=573490 RepID=UPI0020106EE0|nr:glycoside hydrolase family 3 N-terminal domain-containing protein [Frankia sp. AgKG'84/4]MCL9793063.1 glycoside hydrolase family 3 C-terminal domain-containing protein [Frankia sp. AgKG'84/4]
MTGTAEHLNVSRTPARRAQLLLEQMTVAEKSRQLTCLMPMLLLREGRLIEDAATKMLTTGIGAMVALHTEDPTRVATGVNEVQRFLVERTRLGIPALFQVEALSGVVTPRHPIFPTAIALAATWSPDLVREMTDIIRKQMIRLGLRHALSPVLDIAFDPRWGRVHETYGEDPLLAATFGVAFVRGLQGDDLSNGVVATAKHFLGFGLGQGGLNASSFEAGSRFTRDVVAFPVEAAINAAGLRSVMTSYGDVDGVPAGVSRELLHGLLRDEMGFDGFVIADYMAMQHALDRQLVATDKAEIARYALHAGLDLEAPFIFAYGETLAAEVEAGRVPVAELDTAVLRLLTVKFELGLFEQPYAPEGPVEITPVTAEGADLADELAERSVVLLENDGVLPLRPGLRIAVVGPLGHEARQQFATYTYPVGRDMYRFMESGGLGNLEGMDFFRADPEGVDTRDLDSEGYVRYRYGTRSLAEEITDRAARVVVEPACGLTDHLDGEAIARAVAAAREADVVILALGGHSAAIGGGTEGEGTDTADVALPAVQRELADAVAATGTPYVAVLIQGRPYPLPSAVLEASALVVASFAGQAGTRALARALFGEVNPGGKLPYTIPRHGGQFPIYHYQRADSGYRRDAVIRGLHYRDLSATPQYPFGFGRSYTSFDLSDFDVTAEIATDGILTAALTVTNVGDRAGSEVVQLYARVNAAVVTRPAQQLTGFARVDLDPGQAIRVTFQVSADQFAFSGVDRRVAVEAAKVDLFAGTSSDDRRLEASSRVVGNRRVLQPAKRTFLPTVELAPLGANLVS